MIHDQLLIALSVTRSQELLLCHVDHVNNIVNGDAALSNVR